MASYYDTNPITSANARAMLPGKDMIQHFPSEGLFLGSLLGGAVEIPALLDLRAINGLCFLYSDESGRQSVNSCIENLVWRIALTVPSGLCDLYIYNGGNPGDAFNTHQRINRELFGGRKEKVFFDSSADVFKTYLNDIYASIVERMSTIRSSGKKDLVELNESVLNEARFKYQFIFLTDFPRHLKEDVANRLIQIVEAGNAAGIYVVMSWDMNADFKDPVHSGSFDPRQLLSVMEVLVPKGDTFYFRNSGHDEVLNKFKFVIDDESEDICAIDSYVHYIDIQVETAKKARKPAILKQDFKTLEDSPYEPVMSEISVSVGADLYDKHPVMLRFSPKDYIHGFILGQSGSGKSVLLNNIITSAVLKYSPADLMLYLMDFKGVEFNRYKGLKHTKAVLVDNSDSQMTLEVLRELSEENKKRLELFGQCGVSDIDGYNRKHSVDRLPQILFIADECQVMFKEATGGSERIIQRQITEILNTIATQGRSQGIHMLLATQQLDEADISGQILKNLTECFLLMSAPSDSDRLVPDSSSLTSKQMTGLACYYHKQELQSQVQTFYATDEELESAISAAQRKAEGYPGNGEHYFCGSARYYLEDTMALLEKMHFETPIAIVGQNIGIKAELTAIPLRRDFNEHIMLWGINKQDQASGTLLNALLSLLISNQTIAGPYNFFVIDCNPSLSNPYKKVLFSLQAKGLIKLIDRPRAGSLLRELVDDIKNETVTPTILAIFNGERFIEVKRKMRLVPEINRLQNTDEDIISFDMGSLEGLIKSTASESDKMTFPQALLYLLDEGPLHGIHILMQVDKPSSVLFTDEYDVEAALKFRHKVILKSENKYLNPLRFSHDIDVEVLSEEWKHLRAYYYPEDDEPVLFTPFQIPEATFMDSIIKNI